jgi:hypothetical protein
MGGQKTESAIQPLMGFLSDNIDRAEPPHARLRRWPDVRVSDAPEVPATKSACQDL